jgi:hypothetical protein
LVGIQDPESVGCFVIGHGLGSTEVEIADGAFRVPGKEIAGTNDLDGAFDNSREVGGGGVVPLEDASQTVINNPEAIQGIDINNVRIANCSAFRGARLLSDPDPGGAIDVSGGEVDLVPENGLVVDGPEVVSGLVGGNRVESIAEVTSGGSGRDSGRVSFRKAEANVVGEGLLEENREERKDKDKEDGLLHCEKKRRV